LDYWIIPKNEMLVSEFKGDKKIENDPNTEVLLVAIHNDAIHKNNEIARISEVQSSFSDIEVFSAVRAIMDPSLSPQMVIDFGARSTKVYVVERGVLRASHIINRGSQDITLAISKSTNISFDEAEKIKRENGLIAKNDSALAGVSSLTIDYIFSEAGRFIFNYEKTSGRKINKMFLTGGGALLKGLREKAESSFNTPVFMADPFSKVEYPAFLENVLKDAGPAFAVAVGLAIRKLQEF
jgi:type IV pilus assembly protein PilM